jgi:phage shock protein A
MLEAGESLGPPLVVPLGSVLWPSDDPREALDYSYQRQLEALTKVRRGVADVATSRKRVELQAAQLEQKCREARQSAREGADVGREDLASEARTREAAVREQLSDVSRQLSALAGEEERLTVASQRLRAKVDAFRTWKETTKATYAAEEASRTVREAFADIEKTPASWKLRIQSRERPTRWPAPRPWPTRFCRRFRISPGPSRMVPGLRIRAVSFRRPG